MKAVLTLCAERCWETTGQMASNRTRISPGAPRQPRLASVRISALYSHPKSLLRPGSPGFAPWCVIFLGLPRRRAGLAIDLGYYQGARPPPSGPFRGNGKWAWARGGLIALTAGDRRCTCTCYDPVAHPVTCFSELGGVQGVAVWLGGQVGVPHAPGCRPRRGSRSRQQGVENIHPARVYIYLGVRRIWKYL
jgi:hypothetical protein